ncbi:hypothetical protein [Pediococcus stilesii]|uniref:Uncharacterized protein n=1 Tax=Pediococcus stilesii TaxID=331679 RepID=A0A0R2KWF5_9LACO|nr:hypothetical protein [Pediococcus stilesii]KRN93891.1 hypothetical protein IV81_GL001749 [Pediococcus stilesii]TLQ05704.1 hypothetical protein FEZ51_00550 [Pediococcus stilesii]
MKVLANEVIQTLKDASFITEDFKIGKATLKKADGSGVRPAFEFLKDAIQENAIAEAVINVNKSVVIKLQSNIINLPLAYPAPVEKLTEAEREYDINVYAVIEAEDINPSHLRIDEIGTADDLIEGNPDLQLNFRDWLLEQFDRLDNKGKEEPKVEE